MDRDPSAFGAAVEWSLKQIPPLKEPSVTQDEARSLAKTKVRERIENFSKNMPGKDNIGELDPDEVEKSREKYLQMLADMAARKSNRKAQTHRSPLLYVPQRNSENQIQTSLKLFTDVHDSLVETWRTLNGSPWIGGPVIALWPDDEKLANISVDPRTTALCVVPGGEHEIGGWIYGVKPTLLNVTGGELWGEYGPEILDPVVVQAMKSLTTVVNFTSKVVTGADRTLTISTLQLLWNGGHDIVPVEIQAWAIAQGWSPWQAYDLKNLAMKVTSKEDRRSTQEGMQVFGPQSLRRWREEARVQSKIQALRHTAI